MKIGAFEISEPLPELNEPHVIAMLRPWVDVGSVGTVVLRRLERHFAAKELGKLARPGRFFDFTRYRPVLRYVEGMRHVTVPNPSINYTQREDGTDLLFLHLLEPHANSEEYVDSVLELFKTVGVKRYMLVGGMYDVVPHTRPLQVTGSLSVEGGEGIAKRLQIRKSSYEGPTSILYMVSQQARQM
ncbi:MAG: PAC2 family protein, partial [Dehalococcoidia bacterium]